MDREIIRAYIWNEVLRLGFSPSSSKDKKTWIKQYLESVPKFCEIDNYPETPRGEIKGSVSFSDIYFDYSLEETADKFAVTMNFIGETNTLAWTHDFDSTYFLFPRQTFLTIHNQKSQAVREADEDDVREVIKSLITHPTPHQHIKYPIDNHEIRIGGGIKNPFLYLFHLRFQLCPDDDRKNAEENRLVDLFFNTIRNANTIQISELMKVPD